MSDQNTIDGAFQTLSDIQREAASWGDGALMLLAGPGSGKTRVLTSRVARLFANEPAAKWRILALTFTTRAADEMRSRIEQLAPDAVGRLYVGTFHAFACEILRQSGSHIGVQTDFKIYSNPGDRELLLAEALRAADLNLGEPLSKAFPVLDGLRDRLAGPDNCLRFFADPDRGTRFAAAYQAYVDHLARENALDFPAILYMAHKLFTDFPLMAERYRRTYRYISLDEFQDTNLAQYAFVRALTGDVYKNVFVVADDDQVIYQWNGASPQRLQQFAKDYEPAILQMPTNYRCPSEVVEMANRLVANNRLRTANKQPLLSGKAMPTVPDRVRVFEFDEDSDEAVGIAADIKARHGYAAGNVVVIARTKAILQATQEELGKRGIQAQIAQRRDSFASVPYQWLHTSLQVANRRSDEREFKNFVEIGNAMWGFELDTAQLVARAKSTNGDLLRTWAKATTDLPLSPFGAEIIPIVRSDLAERSDFQRYLRAANAALAAAAPTLLEEHPSVDEDARAWKDLYKEIIGAVGRTAPLEAFLQELDLRSKEPPLEAGVIPLLTIHGSKGNEFDHVYLLGLAEDVLPSFQSKKQGDNSPQLEEERRNCFVAITRCMETLTLSRAKSYKGWTKLPSRFLAEMGI
ncbi:DNA helicase-2/ATP-dependent DNA helicase PcrA [Bosea sp. BE271]|jgi:DNA helicase-2/ATP-dependent DNA helicase PcrA|uniref:ATP-dependent helicase n=1 Tax=Bosea TaxID=85413 RepID=UPI002740A12A|nr:MULTISPECIES: ATP-dependent helicase [Bosea]MDR6831568.1 DNA helicase-2/ATP-dependent DNA helicase PcrA [Bosea robiniae]MDR6898277.1 DNA helicase-2/ATP-dependent DNA helicase PcrA [Bosea sp. BE109]MDR7141680.1 DNA helicase-2/ATP-dependent DNA helicase PcrA [Bosea sp. BE168]MDR7178297.1 DNA helicase-2/ATP-dependent DNA helicase PcrA [Bosea sp. BE271]